MAKEGLFFRRFARLSATHVPVAAVILTGCLASVLALIGSFDTLTDYVVFAMWIFYALITGSIFIYRRKYPDLERPYKAWGYPVVPVIFILVAGWLLYRTIVDSPWSSLTGLAIIAAGLPFYFYFVRNALPVEDEIDDV